MKLLVTLRTFASSFFHQSRVEGEMDEELQSHIQHRADDLERSGLSRPEAERRARIGFGAYERSKEEIRHTIGTHLVETFLQDIRFGVRVLRKSPGFTTVAVITLALGIGANTAIFTLLNGLVLRDLSVPQPQQLVRFGAHAPDDSFTGLSLPMFQEIEKNQKVFSGMFAWWGDAVMNVETEGSLSRGDLWAVDGNFYSQLGAVPEIGRLIGPEDADLNSPSAQPVAVLTYDLWQRSYGGDSKVIGKTIRVEGVPFTIIGVSRPGFTGTSADVLPDVVVPLTAEPLLMGHSDIQKHLQRRDALWLDAAARLRPGVTLAEARAQLESLWPSIREAMASGSEKPEQRAHLLTLKLKVESGSKGDSYMRGRFSKPLYILLGISGLVLLIACVNMASLMLARAAGRNREMGVRVALGASRWRLARQMLTESVMLSTASALTGLLFARWASKGLSRLILGEIYIVRAELNLTPDLRILGFSAAAAIFTGILFGLAPAWRATRGDPNAALQRGSITIGTETGRLGRGLIVTQVALSLALLAAAWLLVISFQKLHAVQPGFQINGLLHAGLFPQPEGYKNLNRVSYYRELTERTSNLPDVESAAIAHIMLGSLNEWKERVRVRGTNADGL